MASTAKTTGRTDSTVSVPGAEKTEGLAHSKHEQDIRIRAYEIYLQRGGQPGNELEDWLQAERELTSK